MFQVLRPGVILKVTAPLQALRRLRPSPGTAQPCQADVSSSGAELLARLGHQSTARGTRPGPRAARWACSAHLERAARLSVPGTRLRATALTHQRQTRTPPKTKPEGLPQFSSTEENLSSSFTFQDLIRSSSQATKPPETPAGRGEAPFASPVSRRLLRSARGTLPCREQDSCQRLPRAPRSGEQSSERRRGLMGSPSCCSG